MEAVQNPSICHLPVDPALLTGLSCLASVEEDVPGFGVTQGWGSTLSEERGREMGGRTLKGVAKKSGHHLGCNIAAIYLKQTYKQQTNHIIQIINYICIHRICYKSDLLSIKRCNMISY